ncbi:MAG TPA: Grx4 family monothiol glutaredoxin [Rhodanobacteraceae bacterium]|nr:Grx4 family monothiol glutaredoxin [Rhodanobacteraceae bacterium]
MTDLASDTRARIETLLQEHPVVLFMKGNREAPMCGFSAAASAALNDLLEDYHTVDVLADQDIREGIKAYGQWPTIPQLYVRGELIGGADIVRSMAASGELNSLLGLPPPDRTPPEIKVTEAAASAIRGAMTEGSDDVLHLHVGAGHQAGFNLAPAGEHDIVSHAGGLEIHLDPGSARRARGIVIDWVETLQGAGLSLSFPGSARVRPLSVQALQERLQRGDITLVDVRPAADRARAQLPQALALEEVGEATLAQRPHDAPLAFICHHGHSSAGVARRFAAHGFSEIYNVEGGIDAWAREIDPGVPTY